MQAKTMNPDPTAPKGSSQIWVHIVCNYKKLGRKESQGWHRLEKYLNLEDFFEKSLKNKPALKSTGNSLKSLEKSLNSILFSVGLSTVDRDLNQYKIVLPLFGAAYAVPNIDNNFILIF